MIQTYDGVSIPFADGTLDFIYSVACLQHIPRPFVFNLLFEVKRLLKPTGYAVLHFQSTSGLPEQERYYPWRTEIDNQINNREAHWHHYYTEQELRDVCAATGFKRIAVKDNGAGALVLCVGGDDVEEPGKAPPRNADTSGGVPDSPAFDDSVLTRLQDAEARLSKAVARINALETSTSWRVTAPLRALALAARRLSGRAGPPA
jgi:SAM-dependent methyltransferase